jgi:hypothetical protein
MSATRRPTTRGGSCPLDCPLIPVLQGPLLPPQRNHSRQNARQCYSYQVNFVYGSEGWEFESPSGTHHLYPFGGQHSPALQPQPDRRSPARLRLDRVLTIGATSPDPAAAKNLLGFGAASEGLIHQLGLHPRPQEALTTSVQR